MAITFGNQCDLPSKDFHLESWPVNLVMLYMNISIRSTVLFFALVLAVPSALAGDAHTPKSGSPERKAICDAVRPVVIKRAFKPLPKPIVFQVEFLIVDGNYAGFEGIPLFDDGSAASDYLIDLCYFMVLKRVDGKWQVLAEDLRGDVPTDEEVQAFHKKLPADTPESVFPKLWRRH